MLRLLTQDKGFGVILMIMSLLIIGTLILVGLGYQLRLASQDHLQQKAYLKSYNQAWSALIWAQRQLWHDLGDSWQCKRLSGQDFNVCGRLTPNKQHAILRAKVKDSAALFVLLSQLADGQWGNGLILDYCPYKDEVICE